MIPVYNSQGSLPELVRRLEPVLRAAADEFELVFVDDDSRDDSWRMLVDLSRLHGSWIRTIRLMRIGQQRTVVRDSCRSVRPGGTLAAPSTLNIFPKLLDALVDGVDVVYGATPHGVHGLWRNLASQAAKIALQGALGAETARMVGPFRVFRTEMRRAFDQYSGRFVNVDVLLTWSSSRFSATNVRHDERRVGQSNYTFWKLLTHSLNMVTGFSTVPLQWASVLGFSTTVFGLLLFLYVLGRIFLQGTSVPGFAFLASVIIIFAGAQLVTLGIVGEYLARIHVRLMDRPAYTIRTGEVPTHVSKNDSAMTHD